MNFLDSRQHFDDRGVEILRNANATEDGLAGSGRPVNFKTELNQPIDHLLNLIFTGRILHCDNHECARFIRPQRAKKSALAAFLEVFSNLGG